MRTNIINSKLFVSGVQNTLKCVFSTDFSVFYVPAINAFSFIIYYITVRHWASYIRFVFSDSKIECDI